MTRPSAGVALVLAGLCACAAPDRSAERSPRGALLVVGGGGTTDAIVARAFELAGGKAKRMLVVPQSSGDPEAGAKSRTYWMEKGAEVVDVLDVADPERALELVARADFVRMPGGDQKRLMTALEGTGIGAAIVERYEDGALVGGTSAGAAVMSSAMILGGEKADLESVRRGGTEIGEGLGLWPEAIVDQHFLKRQRFNRLLACVLDHPELVGIGIDERTAVVVRGSSCEVVGEGGVVVVDARRAQRRETKAGEAHSAADVRLSIHRNGDTFDLKPR